MREIYMNSKLQNHFVFEFYTVVTAKRRKSFVRAICSVVRRRSSSEINETIACTIDHLCFELFEIWKQWNRIFDRASSHSRIFYWFWKSLLSYSMWAFYRYCWVALVRKKLQVQHGSYMERLFLFLKVEAYYYTSPMREWAENCKG